MEDAMHAFLEQHSGLIGVLSSSFVLGCLFSMWVCSIEKKGREQLKELELLGHFQTIQDKLDQSPQEGAALVTEMVNELRERFGMPDRVRLYR